MNPHIALKKIMVIPRCFPGEKFRLADGKMYEQTLSGKRITCTRVDNIQVTILSRVLLDMYITIILFP